MIRIGLRDWIVPVMALNVLLLGWWVFRYRKQDLWLLPGVTALVTRFVSYHRWYDDMLLLIPMISLYRLAKPGVSSDQGDVYAGLLLAITIPFMLAPGGIYLLPVPWNQWYAVSQAVLWSTLLAFLLRRAYRARAPARGHAPGYRPDPASQAAQHETFG